MKEGKLELLPEYFAGRFTQAPGSVTVQLSNDGRWFAYQHAPNEGDAEVVLRSMQDGKETRIPIGEPPSRSSGT